MEMDGGKKQSMHHRKGYLESFKKQFSSYKSSLPGKKILCPDFLFFCIHLNLLDHQPNFNDNPSYHKKCHFKMKIVPSEFELQDIN